jgi:hypothetical protein
MAVDRREPAAAHDRLEILRETLTYARERDYTGWDYGDGLSSRLLAALPFDWKWSNIAVQETIKRAPVNLRPVFLVEQRRNFKGPALFAMANLHTANLTGEDRYREEARSLVEWLCANSTDRVPEFAGCHRHDLQGLDGKTPAGTPGVVGTAYGVQALLAAAADIDESYADVAHTAADLVFDRLGYEEIDAGARIYYKPSESDAYHTLNANARGARSLLDLHDDRPDPRLLEGARNILDYVVSTQTDAGGWMYRDPPSASHLSMDNHHNGFIVETLIRYGSVVGDGRYKEALEDALSFYKQTLFQDDGAPNWDESSVYPRDIHAAAQGIIVFSEAGDLAFASRIIDWTLKHLYTGDGRFYYRKERFYTKRITLMRWCQAWMTYALATFLVAERPSGEGQRTTVASAAPSD